MSSVSLAAFGAVGSGLWGGIFAPGEGDQALAYAGAAATQTTAGPATLSSGAAAWSLRGAEISLELEPVGPTVDGAVAELCRVRGEAVIEGSRTAVDCLGCRVRIPIEPGWDSLRAAIAWFDEGNGFAVVARRPRRARGHDRELVLGTLFEEGVALPIAEPRLSTTLRPDGSAIRAGLELWLTAADEEQEEDAEIDPALRFPRRASGEALGPAAAGPGLRDDLLRWRLDGREGLGILRQARGA